MPSAAKLRVGFADLMNDWLAAHPAIAAAATYIVVRARSPQSSGCC
jgi:hypothetical protein